MHICFNHVKRRAALTQIAMMSMFAVQFQVYSIQCIVCSYFYSEIDSAACANGGFVQTKNTIEEAVRGFFKRTASLLKVRVDDRDSLSRTL